MNSKLLSLRKESIEREQSDWEISNSVKADELMIYDHTDEVSFSFSN